MRGYYDKTAEKGNVFVTSRVRSFFFVLLPEYVLKLASLHVAVISTNRRRDFYSYQCVSSLSFVLHGEGKEQVFGFLNTAPLRNGNLLK